MAYPEKTRYTSTPVPRKSGFAPYYKEKERSLWDVSDRVAGKLILMPQRCDLQHNWTTWREQISRGVPVYDTGETTQTKMRYWISTSSISQARWAALSNRARARWTGKLSNPASLGITLATWQQSANMIRDAYRTYGRQIARDEKRLETGLQRRNRLLREGRKIPRQSLEALADLYLSVVFGWLPLMEDIYKGARLLVNSDDVDAYIRASAKTEASWSGNAGGGTSQYAYLQTWSWSESPRCTVAGAVKVSNPNAWMANQLGLINPVVVAVDLIPWSWVAGMFWNQAAFVKQLSDTVGLTVYGTSTTYTVRGHLSHSSRGTGSYYKNDSVRASTEVRQKYRAVGSIPSVIPQGKLPSFDLGLLGIALSLATQRFSRIEGAMHGLYSSINRQ